MAEVAVVHLVRFKNGIEPFRVFIESYLQNYSGLEHDLIIVFKGVDENNDIDLYYEILTPTQYYIFKIPDHGYDITAYIAVAEHYKKMYRYFFFINSFSRLECTGWLEKMYQHLSRSDVGLVGATGSWHRMGNGELHPLILIRNLRERLNQLYGTRDIERFRKGVWKAFSFQYMSLFCIINFPPFKNYHIRTNAFMISSKHFSLIKTDNLLTKRKTYLFESGRNSLSRQIIKMGLRLIVVGKNGTGYEIGEWDKSGTFWQGSQKNLLVSDNQTNEYINGTIKCKRNLSIAAWGVDCTGDLHE